MFEVYLRSTFEESLDRIDNDLSLGYISVSEAAEFLRRARYARETLSDAARQGGLYGCSYRYENSQYQWLIIATYSGCKDVFIGCGGPRKMLKAFCKIVSEEV